MKTKTIMVVSLVTALLSQPIYPAQADRTSAYQPAVYTQTGLYDNVIKQAMELVEGVDTSNKEALTASGYSDKTISAVSDLEIGDIYITTQEDGRKESYIFLNSITALHLLGVDTYEQVSFEFYPSAEYMTYQKEDESYTIPTGLQCKYGEKVTSVELPAGFTWESDGIISDLGSHTYRIRYVPSNPLRYKTVKHIEVDVEGIVNKVEQLSIPAPAPVIYDINKTLEDVPLPDGWVWDNPATVPDSSTSVYPASYMPSPTECYDLSGLPTTKANIPLTVLHQNALTDYKVTIGKGWQLYDIPKPVSETGTYSYKQSNTTYTQAGEYKALLLFTPADGSAPCTVSMDITVDESMPEFMLPSGLTAQYGDTLGSIALPQGWTWVNPDLPVGNAGESKAAALFTDAVNILRKDLSITVRKAVFSPEKPKNMETVWHKGLKLTDIALADGWVWDKGEIKMGENEYAITYAPAGNMLNNYEYKEDDIHAKIMLKVKKATPVYRVPKTISVAKNTMLDDSMLPTADNGTYQWQNPEKAAKSATYLCMFVPKDTKHYRTVHDIEVMVKVFGEDNSDTVQEEKPSEPETEQTPDKEPAEIEPQPDAHEQQASEDTRNRKKLTDIKTVVAEKPISPKLPVNVKAQSPLKNIFARDIEIGNTNDTGLSTDETAAEDSSKSPVEPLVMPATETQNHDAEPKPAQPDSSTVTDISGEAQASSAGSGQTEAKKHGIRKIVVVGGVLILCGLISAGIFLKRKMIRIPHVPKKNKDN